MLSLLPQQVVQLPVDYLNSLPLDAHLIAIGQLLCVVHVLGYILLLCYLQLEALEDVDEGLQFSLLEVIPVDDVTRLVHVIAAV